MLLSLGMPCLADALADAVLAAKPGAIITLPAGTYRGGVTLPPGVILRGAGYRQTIIDADQQAHGISVYGGTGSTVSDLTVQNASVTGILLKGVTDARIARVRVTGNLIGMKVEGATRTRLENCISDGNSYGIVVTDGKDCAVVNCTVVNCPEIGLSFASGVGTTAFNNVVTGSSLGVNIGRSQKLLLDHNLYFCTYVGAMHDQISRNTLLAWQHLSRQDANSVQRAVQYRDIANGDVTPVNTHPTLGSLVTEKWAAETLAGIAAPVMDINGKKRTSRCLGAVEADYRPATPPHGLIHVGSTGIKSAGVFKKDGTLLSYLFHNLPLPAGEHSFWLPARDYTGNLIAQGDYEVRLVESDLQWQYLNHIGDNGGDRGASWSAPVFPGYVAFDKHGGLVMGHGWSEDHTNVRCYDVKTGVIRWKLRGATNMRGVTTTDDAVYVLRADTVPKSPGSRLTRLDSVSGVIQPWKGDEIIHAPVASGTGTLGLDTMQGKLYSCNADGLEIIEAATGALSIHPMKGVTLLAADNQTGVLWIVRDGVIIAMSADLRTLASYQNLVASPAALSACNGMLAAASRTTGKVHIFSAADPKNLRPLRTVGRGDGPYGEYRTDRFLFQDGAEWKDQQCDIALGPQGELAVVDHGRLIMLDKKGKTLWYTFGVFGNQTQLSHGTQYRRLWDTFGDRSFTLNEKTGQWTPEAFWDISSIPNARTDAGKWELSFLGDFSDGGKVFGVYVRPYNRTPSMTVVRYDKFHAVPVLILDSNPITKTMFFRKDSNRDGKIDAQDDALPVLDAAGKPVRAAQPFMRFNYLLENGDLLTPITRGMTYLWQRAGLDNDGVPVYRWADRKELIGDNETTLLNPYDRKSGGMGQITKLVAQPDGGWTMQAMLRGSGGSGLNNGAGTDLFGYSADGRLRWVHQLADYKGIAGLGSANGVTVTAIFYSGEFLAFDPDGLGLGGFTEASELHYAGYWIDHPNMLMYRGRDGHGYVTTGDNYNGRHPWYRLTGDDRIVRTRTPLIISDATAQVLAKLPEGNGMAATGVKPRQVSIARLAEPMPIDGGLEKWRAANVTPQIIIGPTGSMAGPGDCSAIIRLAYEGQNLYVQVLKFDDVATFHQGVVASHQQDSVEMCLNGNFPNGFQFVTLKIPDGTDAIVRRRFFANMPDQLLDPKHCPRIVTVLPDARDVSERSLLESIYGVDLAQSKVIITEYKLPIDAKTYAPAKNDVFPLGPGKTFWIGFMVNDNDDPGTDFQDYIAWPSTFGSFNPKESGAFAICE
jgi:parallel beta-helix repeat protein